MKKVLEVSGVTFSYGEGPIVLFDIDLSVEPGTMVGLVGPNGSGKSTLINLVFDHLELARGSITVSGQNHRSAGAKMDALYLPSEDFLPDFLTGREYCSAVRRMYGAEEVSNSAMGEMFDELGMSGREDHLIEDYSHGMKKKLQFITAFLLERPLTVIDETFNGLDLDAQRYCSGRLAGMRDRGLAILLCTHDFALLEELADEVVVLQKGYVLDRFPIGELQLEGKSLKMHVDEMLFGDHHENV